MLSQAELQERLKRAREKQADSGYSRWLSDVQNHLRTKHGVQFAASAAGTGSMYIRLNSGHTIRLSDHPSARTSPKPHLSLVYPQTTKVQASDPKNTLRWGEELPSHNWQSQIDTFMSSILQKASGPIRATILWKSEWPK